MSKRDKPIDQTTGDINVYELCPQAGDSIMVVNCGTHFEIRYHHWHLEVMTLSDDDLQAIRQGLITWH